MPQSVIQRRPRETTVPEDCFLPFTGLEETASYYKRFDLFSEFQASTETLISHYTDARRLNVPVAFYRSETKSHVVSSRFLQVKNNKKRSSDSVVALGFTLSVCLSMYSVLKKRFEALDMILRGIFRS